jgi:hypothetical protein
VLERERERQKREEERERERERERIARNWTKVYKKPKHPAVELRDICHYSQNAHASKQQ